ncbi:MAG: hypothetical protein PsegKO_02380 [Pseudohongiellaceae bacterium]
MNTTSASSLFEDTEPQHSVQISTESLLRGIDNYHIDVRLSRRFCSDIRKLVSLVVSQQAVPQPRQWDNSKLYDKLREKYLDMMTVLIHRVQTDLSTEEVCLLQFAPVKFVVATVRAQLDQEIRSVAARLAEHRNKGSSEALATQQRLFWLKKNYDPILYSVNRQIFTQLQRVEERQLAPIRLQYLDEKSTDVLPALTNPLLFVSELSALPLLVNEFSMWNSSSDDGGFIKLNEKLEKLLNKRIKQLNIPPLRNTERHEQLTTEIHDELNGLFLSQPFLGPAQDSKAVVTEEFSWFENPEMVEKLFNEKANLQDLAQRRKELGFRKSWHLKREIKAQSRLLKGFVKLLRSEKLFGQMLASHYMRRSISPAILEHVDLKTLCQYLAGLIPLTKVNDSLNAGTRLNSEQLKSLEQLRAEIETKVARADTGDVLRMLLDVSRYRRLLKYYRFAHRCFNRMALRSTEEDIKLSRSAGTLYAIPTSAEIEQDEARICHHAILKADVRGSTTVTDELLKKGLNPASYFSMRFFNPINKILETYGANKVFIEGDAIILSFLEYENAPQQWYSVARACGYARDMLKITGSNNRYSTQMGLPLLELGVGICYSDETPRYLYDGDHPIMISGAIGLADRMSGCSWNLRAALKKGLFNVDVLQIGEGESSKGEKGQHYLRYNVNGINIDDAAFAKLKKEISLRSVRMKLNDTDFLFHVGQYPDAKGRNKDLVIREGKIGLWKDEAIHDNNGTDESYYEVVVNRKVLPLVLEAVNKSQTASV